MATKTGYADINGTQLYYEVAGDGSPLILIHGGQLDRRMWDDQFDFFAQHCQVIRYDVRDHGLSQCPEGPYSDHEDLLGLMDYLVIDKAAVLGLSMGGTIVIDFALAYPEKVLALIPVCTAPSGFNEPSEQAVENANKMMEAWQAGDMDGVVEYFQRSFTDGPYRTPDQVDLQVRERVRMMAHERIIQGPSQGDKQPLMPPAIERLDEIQAPTLTIIGDLDMADLLQLSETLVEKVSGAERVVISGAAHMVNMERPEEFNRAVLDFLGRVGSI